MWYEVYNENTRMSWEDKFLHAYWGAESEKKEKSNSTGIKLSTELVSGNHLILKANNLETSF